MVEYECGQCGQSLGYPVPYCPNCGKKLGVPTHIIENKVKSHAGIGIGIGLAVVMLFLFIIGPMIIYGLSDYDYDEYELSEEYYSDSPYLENNQRVINVYIDPLPSEVEPMYLNSIREAMNFWERNEPNLVFRETGESENDVVVQWVKELSGIAGQAYGEDFMQVGLGDSECSGEWRLYTYDTILNVAVHEMGHVIGKNHIDDSGSVMYSTVQTVYEEQVDERNILSDGWYATYPLCTRSTESYVTYNLEIDSDERLDIYFLDSYDEIDRFSESDSFQHYSQCDAESVRHYNKECTVNPEGVVLIYNPVDLDRAPADFEVTLKEIETKRPLYY